MDLVTIKRALVSVSDKSGIVEFVRGLTEFGVEIVSTGGTAKALSEAGIEVIPIDEVTGFPEMMEGRVKTLHPKVHGALLADRSKPEHMAQAEEHGIVPIDMVVVNLYPFEATVAKPDVAFAEAIENIDIGGPSMLRSAAKNHAAVTVVTDPADYDAILEEMKANDGATTLDTRTRLAKKVFGKTAAYDAAIYGYLCKDEPFPERKVISVVKAQDLRYGENPHQRAAFYRDSDAHEHTLAMAEQLQGKALSYNNILDTDGAWSAVAEFQDPACVIVKHTNPCGVAIASDVLEAYKKAHDSDPVSAFGGVIAFNRTVPASVIEEIYRREQFVEVMIAPSYEAAALELLRQKENLRVLRTGGIRRPQDREMEMRKVEGGLLVQDFDTVAEQRDTFTVPTKREPTKEEWEQLLFAWHAAKSVKSNCILLVKDYASIGVGAGQMSRVDAAKIAVEKAGDRTEGCVAASDAFMPFSDSLEVVAAAGATAVIQPGGSMRDEEVIAKADELGVAMVFTGHRHFRH
ncbi:MAG: bifunctional phosphoribosylaminoimidazolecarboxamide formyltransferase/IMP cyclohydrolase [Coriobacteriia bacterium]